MNLEAFIAKAGAEPIASRSRRGPGRVLHAPRDRGLRSRIRWSPASAPMQTRWSRRPTSVCGVHSASRNRRATAARDVSLASPYGRVISARGVYVASRDRRRKIPRRVAKTSRDRRGIAAHAVVPSSAESVESRQNVQSPGTSWASSC